ncbi:MAG: ferrous iron transport protein A [Spirochaetes bacterium]|nr:ferrous iron transport protein A [Spirochaetota bacterium]
MCITEIKNNERFRIDKINGGPGLIRRLRDLGLLSGEEILMIKNENKGPIIINVKGSMIALGRGIAQKIYGQKIS